jgi:5-methylcytosine-specific restriction endonuclease McrA
MSERHIPAELRRLVADRGQHCCEYCRTQARYSADSFTVDHIIPRSLGGATTADNLALCCHGCNQHKSRRTVVADPVTETLVRLFHPREQRWEAHFARINAVDQPFVDVLLPMLLRCQPVVRRAAGNNRQLNRIPADRRLQ